jgi:hypothetical protein
MAINLNGTTGITTTGLTSNGIDDNATSTAMTLDTSGNVLVGKTVANTTTLGNTVYAGIVSATMSGDPAIFANRAQDGSVIEIQKNGTTVGSIGSSNTGERLYMVNDSTGLSFIGDFSNIFPCDSSGTARDNAINLGGVGGRFKDLYLSGGVYLGGTGSANKLDDYEEGTFTPNIQPTSGSITWLSSADTLSYIKVGSAVHIFGRVTVDSVSSPSGITRGSVPFTMKTLDDQAERTTGVCLISGTSINTGDFALYPNAGGAFLEIIRTTTSTIARDAGAFLQSGCHIDISQTYYAA